MSYELRFNTGAGDHLATTSGWGDVARWIERLPATCFPALHSLAEEGCSDRPAELSLEIDLALEHRLPNKDICGILARVKELVESNMDADECIISSGA